MHLRKLNVVTLNLLGTIFSSGLIHSWQQDGLCGIVPKVELLNSFITLVLFRCSFSLVTHTELTNI